MRILTALAAAAVMAMPASAVTIFSQNFDSASRANNTTNVPGFTVTGGVDIISNGTAGVLCAGAAGRCLDLVGSPNVGSITSTPINFNAGRLITVSFHLSGNPRAGTPADIFNFALGFTDPENIASVSSSGFQTGYGTTGVVSGFGTYSESINRTRPFLSYVLSFVPTSSGTLSLVFSATGNNDARGPILDNILVDSAVPEPASWLMLIAGFGMVGIAARRRRSSVAA
ncbi:PEPxxWA-CTERM sorting domain-containing protein [Sandarakinorhabdus limnophila]|uniref:PEPxxWA-CTERM sorting domain-containing protein n=1 Tax=Sandarakinorhabdus limnophila TaxID=210512 RepID=UPI0003B32317|nr:PEPxxWA-CTERM sorting domain-containing protein [Sandarakinorhabdus limnophila]